MRAVPAPMLCALWPLFWKTPYKRGKWFLQVHSLQVFSSCSHHLQQHCAQAACPIQVVLGRSWGAVPAASH